MFAAQAMVGALGGKVGLAPRLYLKKLVGDVLDRIEQFPDSIVAAFFSFRSAPMLRFSSQEMADVEMRELFQA